MPSWYNLRPPAHLLEVKFRCSGRVALCILHSLERGLRFVVIVIVGGPIVFKLAARTLGTARIVAGIERIDIVCRVAQATASKVHQYNSLMKL